MRIVGLAGSLLAASGTAGLVHAASHSEAPFIDSPSFTATLPRPDLTDVFAWMTGERRLALAMGWVPDAAADARFVPGVQWAFHLAGAPSFGAAAGAETAVVCTFDEAQAVSCWAGDEYVHGDARGEAGVTSASGRMRVFTGRRDDPFFFYETGFRQAAGDLVAAGATRDAAGCPAHDAAAVARIGRALTSGSTDELAGDAVLMLVVELDPALVTADGPLVSVWASTHLASEGAP